jgi:Flp pilus assembly protein TadB
MTRKNQDFIAKNRKALIFLSFGYVVLLIFMLKMIGIGATSTFFLFLAICSLPTLIARALGDKRQTVDNGDKGGYRYIYSYRYGSKFGDHR